MKNTDIMTKRIFAAGIFYALLLAPECLRIGHSTRLRETVVARAGDTATIPCPGLSDSSAPGGYIVNKLIWSCSSRRKCPASDERGDLAEFEARSVAVRGDRDRVRLDQNTWSLVVSPVRADDSGVYSCSFNSQAADRRLIQLIVLDVPSTPGRPMVMRHSSRQVELSWAPSFQTNNSPIQHYVIQTRKGDRGPWPSVLTGHRTASNATNSTVTGLVPFSVYTFRVVAANGIGYSNPSEPSYPVSTLRERPGAAPRLVVARNVSSTAVRVEWRPPPAASLHGEFTGYRLGWRQLEAGRRPGPPAVFQLHDLAARTHLLEGLEPYTEYEIILQVANPEGLGPPASVTVCTGEGVPSRPENVTATAVGDRSLTLSWLPPRRANGVLRDYTVFWANERDPVAKRQLPLDAGRSFTLTGLEPDTAYTLWLAASTGAGEGARSAPVNTRTDVSGPDAPDITNITCPSDSALGLQWRRPERVFGPVDLYYVLYRFGERWDYVKRVVPVRSDQTEYSIQLPNLTANQIYEIRIQGATLSKLVPDKVHKGRQSLPRKVRLARGCEEIQPYSTWKHRPRAALVGPEVTAIFVSCLVLLFVAIMAAVWRRRRRRYSATPLDKRTAAGACPGWSAPAHDAVPCHLFVQHVRQLHADDGDALRREWETLQLRAPLADGSQTGGAQQASKQTEAASGGGVTAQACQTARVAVRSKRYRGRPVPAAYAVDGYRQPRAYLVTERPGPTAYDALWRLVWEQGVRTVVLIGTLTTYADRFWPEPGCVRPSGDLQVEGQSEETLATCVVRSLTVYKQKSRSRKVRKERRVNFFQYTLWPEYGLPDNPLPLLDFVERTVRQKESTHGPILVISGSSHCSLGLYVGLVTLLAQLRRASELAVFSYWHHVIGQSPYFLTTLEEYSLLHDCLLERVTSGDTVVSRDRVTQYTDSLQGGSRNSYPYPAAERQYMSVVALEAHQYTVTSATKPYNESKNSCPSFVPMEASRVCLTPKLSVEGSDYINASWMPGFRQLQEFIVTQHPLPGTVLDFWQMIWDNRVTTAVCLTSEDCGVFWPLEEEEIDCERFLVRYMSETVSDSVRNAAPCITRSFLIESTEGEDDVTVRLVYLPHWPRDLAPAALLDGVQLVASIQGDKRTPLVTVDRYGGTEAASFCLLSTVLRQLRNEGLFDIFTYAKLYHQRRPGIWRTMAEFLYLYQVVEAWLSSLEGGATVPAARVDAGSDKTFIEARLSGVDGVIV